MLLSYRVGGKPRYSAFKCQKSYGKVSLKAKNPTEKIKIQSGQNVTAMGWPILQWFEISHSDKPSIFWGGQIIHRLWVEMSQWKIVTESECHLRKMSHGRSVIVENCHSGQNIL